MVDHWKSLAKSISFDGKRPLSSDNNQKNVSDVVAAIFPDSKQGSAALRALEKAVSSTSSSIERIPFEKLDYGETESLDKFYSAPVVVVDVTERNYEACLYYQIGLRESYGMKHNVVLCADQECGKKNLSVEQSNGSVMANVGVSSIVASLQAIEFIIAS